MILQRFFQTRATLSSNSKQYKLYLYKAADVNAQYTTSIEKTTGKWIDSNTFELQATLKNQSDESIAVESNDGFVSNPSC